MRSREFLRFILRAMRCFKQKFMNPWLGIFMVSDEKRYVFQVIEK